MLNVVSFYHGTDFSEIIDDYISECTEELLGLIGGTLCPHGAPR